MRHTLRYARPAAALVALLLAAATMPAHARQGPALECTQFSAPIQVKAESFSVEGCMGTVDDEPVAEMRFIHQDAQRTIVTTLAFDPEAYMATVDEPSPKIWDGHILTAAMRQERGGVLLIANWTGQEFVVSEHGYGTGDEDDMTLSWKDGAFIVQTVPEGTLRLVAATGKAATPGTFVQESLSCDSGDELPTRHSITLGVDVDGRPTSFSYLAASPVPDGTSLICPIDAERGISDAEWTDGPPGTVTIAMDPSAEPTDDGPTPDQVVIVREGERYTISFDVLISNYCGQSSAIARQLVLTKGSPSCKVIMPED